MNASTLFAAVVSTFLVLYYTMMIVQSCKGKVMVYKSQGEVGHARSVQVWSVVAVVFNFLGIYGVWACLPYFDSQTTIAGTLLFIGFHMVVFTGFSFAGAEHFIIGIMRNPDVNRRRE